ncbi:MAG: hypothetical protein ABSD11_11720 [Methylocella sp.]|jgi:hypothetical protein
MPDDQAGGFSPASWFPHGTGHPALPLNATAGSLAMSTAPSTAESINTPERLVVIFSLSFGCCTSASERSRFNAVYHSEASRGRNTTLVKIVP